MLQLALTKYEDGNSYVLTRKFVNFLMFLFLYIQYCSFFGNEKIIRNPISNLTCKCS
jgi:hypothetical protein